MAILDKVSIPGGINGGLSSPSATYLTSVIGAPKIDGAINPALQVLLSTESVGPFQANGLQPAVASLRATLQDVAVEAPDVYSVLGSAGMLNIRFVAGTSIYSNHSWGAAIDLKLGGNLDTYGDGLSYEGLARIAPIFNRHGWYWGATFPKEDSMHFEVSTQKVGVLDAAGVFDKKFMHGTASADAIAGSSVDEIIVGYERADRITGGEGNDSIYGDYISETTRQPGNDVIDGGGGNDKLYANEGDDNISGGWGFDQIDGGAGRDTVDYSFYTSSDGMNVNLGSGKVSFRPEHSTGGVESVVNVENVTGGGGKDTLTGSPAVNTINGGGGDDWMYGGAGNDILKGGAGLDSMSGETGNDAYDYDAVSESPGDFYRSDGISFDYAGASAGDRIDLSTIDANPAVSGNQAFSFTGKTAPASGSGLAKVWTADGYQANFGNITLVNVSTDSDKDPEMLIRAGDGTATASTWVAGDFIL
jgi:Ca2+-binding RTX toxin-like protein